MDQTLSAARARKFSLRIGNSAGILTFLFLMFWLLLSLHQENPPSAASAAAPVWEFSSGRAMKHVETIAKQPRPPGSTEHTVVREYIVNALAADGLEPLIQTTIAINRQRELIVAVGTVQNVLARLAGTNNSKAVLLAAHYDSKPQTFGASDDGAGVSALLETLRALKSGPPLKNDVILLFTDGEEEGLLGSNGFMAEHPWARNIGLVLNFEARGNGGPSIMFETSLNNGWLVREFAKAAPYPQGSSLYYEVYKRLPNTTDFTTFKEYGLQGLNFAYIDGLSSYHTLLDSVERIDERSLQHHGSYALALTRHFGNLDLRQAGTSDRVFFDIFGSALVHYSYAWVTPLTILTLLLFLLLVVIGLRRGLLTISGICLGSLAFLLTAALVTGLEKLLWTVIFNLRYASDVRPQGETYYSNLYLMGFVGLAISVTTTLYNLFRRKVSTENLAAGGLIWWAILMLAATVYLPGASYLLTWPLIFSVVGLGVSLALKYREQHSVLVVAVLLAGSIPGLVLLVPLTYQLFVGLTLNSIWFVAVMVLLQLGLLIPHLDLMARGGKWLLPGAGALAAGCFIAAGIWMPTFNEQHPRPNSILYALNADTGKAVWASLDPKPDEWTRQFLSADPQRKPLNDFLPPYLANKGFLQNSAPAIMLSPPAVAVVNDEKNGEVRALRLRLTSSRGAPLLSLFVDSRIEVLRVSLNGKRLDESNLAALRSSKDRWNMRYVALPPDGAEFTVEFKAPEPLKLRVVDQSYGVPQIPGSTARPKHMIPSSDSFSDTTLVSKTFTF